MGSIRDDGRAGTGCSSSSNCRKSFDDQAARASYVDGAPNPVKAHLLAHSLSGAKASGLSTQVSAALGQKPAYVTLLIGANDLCTSSTSNMTSTGNFATQVRASLAALHQGLPEAKIFVSSIPNIYQLWSVLHGNWVARFVWSTASICQSMLASTNTETARQQVVAREAAFNQILS